MFQPSTTSHQLTPDMQWLPYYRWLNRNFLLLQLPLAALLYALGGWPLVLWGIPLRLVLVYPVIWLENSATHRWGYVSHASGDGSRNNWWVALPYSHSVRVGITSITPTPAAPAWGSAGGSSISPGSTFASCIVSA